MKSIEEFTEWMKREIPSGTVISNPEWWSNRIHKAFLAAYTKQQEPVAEVLKPDEWTPSYVRWIGAFPCVTVGTKLYAAPPLPAIPAHLCVVPRELSDKTSDLLGDTYGHPPRGWKITYARILAMIAAGEKS